MSKKIGTFLMAVLVIWAVLLLDATKNRELPQTSAPPTETTQAAEAAPSQPEWVPPETTAPGEALLNAENRSRVEEVLSRQGLPRTAVTYLVRSDPTEDTLTAALAELASRKEMNPIAGFWLLVSEGLYEQEIDRSGLPEAGLPELSDRQAKRFAYTDAGAAQFLSELLALADGMEVPMAQAVLGEDGTVAQGLAHLSAEDGCRYAYFAHSTRRCTRILCVYLRTDAQGEWITDVEFQLLEMTGTSDPEVEGSEAAALAAAAELLMTGTHRVREAAGAYEVGGFRAEAEQFFFTAEGEQGSLINYRLKK